TPTAANYGRLQILECHHEELPNAPSRALRVEEPEAIERQNWLWTHPPLPLPIKSIYGDLAVYFMSWQPEREPSNTIGIFEIIICRDRHSGHLSPDYRIFYNVI